MIDFSQKQPGREPDGQKAAAGQEGIGETRVRSGKDVAESRQRANETRDTCEYWEEKRFILDHTTNGFYFFVRYRSFVEDISLPFNSIAATKTIHFTLSLLFSCQASIKHLFI